jgi:hypothetical protein
LYKKPTASIGVFTDRDERLGATVFKRGEPYTTTTPTFGIAQLTSNRTGFAFRKYTNAEDLELYQYWRNQAGSCGDQFYLQGCEAGRWYTIKMRVNLGSSTTDGNVKVWVNGVEKLNRNFRYLASGASWKLNGMMFHSFMGGNTSSWAPNADTYLMIDNYRVDDNAF